MGIEARISWGVRLLLVMLLVAVSTRAQFTGNIQGTVVDPSGAAIAQAKVALENLGNHISATTTTDGEGGYRFLSLAPGSYKISVEAAGFSRAETTITLETNQNLNVPFAVKVGAASSSVTVTAEAPLLNTAETRNQLTLETQELSTLPNPDVVQETSIQVNTFSVEYGRGSGLETTMTTKSGSDEFHGLASDYFTRQSMYAKYSLPNAAQTYAPFHGNNISATIGGPIISHHQFFFFFGIEALRSAVSTGNQVLTFADPAFASWAQANYPNTFGTKLLTTYVPTHIAGTTATKTANDIFPGSCGTSNTNGLPCSTPMIDSGTFNGTNFRNGTQYFARVDKYFKNDRFYGSFFRTLLGFGGPAAIQQFTTSNNTWERAFQVNWTHTFSPTLLNEAVFAQNRIEGKLNETGDFTIPTVIVTGQNLGYGLGFAQGDFIQHNYHWRDVLTNVRGAHVLKVGYDGWFGDDVEPFQGPWSHPSFNFDNLLKLAQDAPSQEQGVMTC